VLFGALNVKTGQSCFHQVDRWNQWGFQDHLRQIRSVWGGWRIVLFLDRGSPHLAKRSLALAKALRIELRWLPTQCSELNPVEALWREVKNFVLANEPTPDVVEATMRARCHLESLTHQERRRKAGVLSGNFWLPT
jgi:DDE superfamily endonuclease